MRDRVLSLVPARTGQSVTPLPDLGPATSFETCSYRFLAPKGIETVLEVTIQRMALKSYGGGGASGSISVDRLNPRIHLIARTWTRVIKTTDESVLFNATRRHDGRGATFTEWAASDAQLLRAELDQFLPRLTGEIVAQVFGESAPPTSEPASPVEPEHGKRMESQQEFSRGDAEWSGE